MVLVNNKLKLLVLDKINKEMVLLVKQEKLLLLLTHNNKVQINLDLVIII